MIFDVLHFYTITMGFVILSLLPSFLHTYELTVCIDAVQVSVDIDMIGKAVVTPRLYSGGKDK